jgi:hypothetical protein
MSSHTLKWAPALGVGVLMDFQKSSESNFRGQNSLDWRVFYIIRNLSRRIYNTSYGQEKGWESKCQFDFRSLKVKNRLDLLICRWRATYLWKAFNKGYSFFLKFTLIKGLHKKLWASKMVKVLILGISRLMAWES